MARKSLSISVRWNSPAVLWYAVVACLVLLLRRFFHFPTAYVILSSTFRFDSVSCYVSLLAHSLGHSDWAHLIANFSLILMVGPMIEDRYGPGNFVGLVLVTSVVSGVFHIVFSRGGIGGASDVVFMLLVLASFTRGSGGSSSNHWVLPVTSLLVVVLYLVPEVTKAIDGHSDGIGHFSHVVGGLTGAVFGLTGFANRVGKALHLNDIAECCRKTKRKAKRHL